MGSETSLRKVEANRQNALQSTGPRTEDGKNKVKLNALKHGLLAKEVVIPVGDGKEDPLEFADLHGALVDHLQPVGKLEELLVEEIAVGFWRRRRAVRCEVGAIRRDADMVRFTSEQRRKARVANSMNVSEPWALRESSEGLQFLIEALEGIGYTIQNDEELDGEAHSLFSGYFAWGGALLEDVKSNKKVLLDLIRKEQGELRQLKAPTARKEALELDAIVAMRALPPDGLLTKILRYEAAIDRQLHRAMTQLERLQRQRRGDNVPPPISVEVSQGA